MKQSLFVTVIVTISCGLLWVMILAATHRGPVFDANEMVRVDGGTILDPNQPGKEIEVSPFLIDKYEVTNAQYKKFKPEHTFSEDQADFPVTNITYEEAMAYAENLGKTLPTEAEWQLAAGAARGQKFPWGMEKRDVKVKSVSELHRVGSIPENVSPYGCFDMEGNVWEWTSDDVPATSANNISSPTSGKKILKGGWSQTQKTVIAASIADRKAQEMHKRSPQVGFRCIRRLHPSDMN
ncbi:MAG: formylglycine-generating enzyme family protein [candidate division KSB1 bacterium]|nr:formylglycine-generating enzyme family protein [candidate division KSB1 bacterium]